MIIQATSLALVLSLAILSAYAEEPKKIEELGNEQKLQRLFELYRVEEIVSLKPREFRFNFDIAYAFDDRNEFGAHISQRSLELQGSFAYGITDWLETVVTVPFQWNQNRVETLNATLASQSLAGLGDMSIRILTALPVKTFGLTGVFNFILPTGRDGLGRPGLRSSFGLNASTTIRPAFLFGGLAWERDWETEVNAITYTGGVGFYLNYALAAGLDMSGTRFLNPPRGGIYDTASATVRVTYQVTPTLGVIPYAVFGLTDSAPDVITGLNLSRRF